MKNLTFQSVTTHQAFFTWTGRTVGIKNQLDAHSESTFAAQTLPEEPFSKAGSRIIKDAWKRILSNKLKGHQANYQEALLPMWKSLHGKSKQDFCICAVENLSRVYCSIVLIRWYKLQHATCQELSERCEEWIQYGLILLSTVHFVRPARLEMTSAWNIPGFHFKKANVFSELFE